MKTIQIPCRVLALLLCGMSGWAADSDFYHRFLSLVDTNEFPTGGVTNGVLVDRNNKAPKLGHAVISLQKLRTEGEVRGIRLGMTMDDVVARWGKPCWLHPRCAGGHRFLFTDCALVFQGNALSMVRFQETAVFDQGLSAGSSLQEWRKALGEPTQVHESDQGSAAVYETHGKVRTVLLLEFQSDGDARSPPAIYLDPPLTNWFRKVQP